MILFVYFFFLPLVIDQNRLLTCINLSQTMPAAAMISFYVFDQFHPTTAPQGNNNNYTWSHYCCTIVFIPTKCDLKKKLIEELEMELTELIHIWLIKTEYIHTDLKAYTALKRGQILLILFSTITLLIFG